MPQGGELLLLKYQFPTKKPHSLATERAKHPKYLQTYTLKIRSYWYIVWTQSVLGKLFETPILFCYSPSYCIRAFLPQKVWPFFHVFFPASFLGLQIFCRVGSIACGYLVSLWMGSILHATRQDALSSTITSKLPENRDSAGWPCRQCVRQESRRWRRFEIYASSLNCTLKLQIWWVMNVFCGASWGH